MEGLVGFNSAQVAEFGTTLINVAKRTDEIIVEKLTSGLVTPMSSVWYAPEGVEYFSTLKQSIKSKAPEISSIFEGFRLSVESAASAWAARTKAPAVTLAKVPDFSLDLDVSSIQDNNGGNMGINIDGAKRVASGLTNLEADIKASLETLAATLSAESSFLGNGQAAAVNNAFSRIYAVLTAIFKSLTEGEGSVYSVIDNSAEKYKALSEEVGTAFNA